MLTPLTVVSLIVVTRDTAARREPGRYRYGPVLAGTGAFASFSVNRVFLHFGIIHGLTRAREGKRDTRTHRAVVTVSANIN